MIEGGGEAFKEVSLSTTVYVHRLNLDLRSTIRSRLLNLNLDLRSTVRSTLLNFLGLESLLYRTRSSTDMY